MLEYLYGKRVGSKITWPNKLRLFSGNIQNTAKVWNQEHFLSRSQQYKDDPGSSHTDQSTSTVMTANKKVESMWNSAAVA